MPPPEIKANNRAGDDGCEEDKLKAHLPARGVQGQWGRGSSAQIPLLSSPSRLVSGVIHSPLCTVKSKT